MMDELRYQHLQKQKTNAISNNLYNTTSSGRHSYNNNIDDEEVLMIILDDEASNSFYDDSFLMGTNNNNNTSTNSINNNLNSINNDTNSINNSVKSKSSSKSSRSSRSKKSERRFVICDDDNDNLDDDDDITDTPSTPLTIEGHRTVNDTSRCSRISYNNSSSSTRSKRSYQSSSNNSRSQRRSRPPPPPISTMSASALTFDTNTTRSYSSSTHSSSQSHTTNNSSYISQQQRYNARKNKSSAIIPHQVSFANKQQQIKNGLGVISEDSNNSGSHNSRGSSNSRSSKGSGRSYPPPPRSSQRSTTRSSNSNTQVSSSRSTRSSTRSSTRESVPQSSSPKSSRTSNHSLSKHSINQDESSVTTWTRNLDHKIHKGRIQAKKDKMLKNSNNRLSFIEDSRKDKRRGSRRSRSLDHGRDGKNSSNRELVRYNDDDDSYYNKRDRRRSLSRGRASRHLVKYDDRRQLTKYGDRGDDTSYMSGERSHSSKRSRYDVDDDGYCVYHPNVQLMKLRYDDNGQDSYWRTVRKRCPDCIADYYEDEEDRSYDDDRSYEDTRSYNDDNNNNNRENRPRRHLTHSSSYHSSMGASTTLSTIDPFWLGDMNMISFTSPEQMEEEEDTNRLKRRLAARAYHFPGNTWTQDWLQYLSNTHTVLGLFFHHPLHPMGFQERLVILFGSVAIGLTISNFTYLWFIRNDISVDEEVFNINSRHTDYTGIPVVSITKLMLTLWTLGSFLHTCFDLGLWHMKACTLCRYKGGSSGIDDRLIRWGRVAGLFIVMIAMGVGGYAVLLRASIEYQGEGSVADEVSSSIVNSEIYNIEFEDKRSFRFLLGYLVEFVLALFVYYPIAVTILFSGVLGCGGRVPLLGGRPREVKRERRYEEKKKQRASKILKANAKKADCDSTTDNYTTSYRDDESQDMFNQERII